MSAPDNNSVEKILRLKRYEQPPPRYFNEFSERVAARIENGEGRLSWWERFGIDLRPALAAGAGMVACGLIVYGVATSDSEAIGNVEQMAVGDTAPAKSLLVNAERAVAANSTNPVATYGTPVDRALFETTKIVPASFQMR